jgi:excisionase family DNA binding protein
MAAKTKPKSKAPSETSDILTLAEAAAYLKVSEEVLLREAELGRIPARQLGNEWRFCIARLQDWFGQQQPTSSDQLSNKPVKTGEEAVARIRAIRGNSNSTETLDEVEEFIRSIYKARKEPLA